MCVHVTQMYVESEMVEVHVVWRYLEVVRSADESTM